MINKIQFQLNEILNKVSKPARYIGAEFNQVNKDPSNIKFRIALCYPDIYEIGMSHLGWKILYHIINKREDSYAERIFIPWVDMEKIIKSHGFHLYSLETKTPLLLFDMVGFSVLYELCFTNILTALHYGGIPIKKDERKNYHPIIIAGGACTFNPEPLSDIIDLFVIGDGEDIINEIIDTYLEIKKDNPSRKDLLKSLSSIEGIYVPDLYEKKLDLASGLIYRTPKKNAPYPIKKRITENLNNINYPTDIIVPHIEVTHDRISVEIMRGCERGCRFCHAGMTTRPVRHKYPTIILNELINACNSTGYDETSLSSLSTGDYPYLESLLNSITDTVKRNQVAISLPSLFPASLSEKTILEILKIRKTGITIAPEAASENLRAVINKPMSNDEIFKAAEIAFKNGWQLIKLYFMIGLPNEDENDLKNIAYLANEISKLGTKQHPASGQLNITISSFVPKAHTPFQFASMNSIDQLIHKQNIIKHLISKNKKITLKLHNPYMSWLEAIFARGDCRLNSIIYQAWLDGCRLDGWEELFNYNIWFNTFNKMQLDPYTYLKQLPTNSILPWDHIHTGVNKNYLISQWEKSLKKEITKPTNIFNCNKCGVCNNDLLKRLINISKSLNTNQLSPDTDSISSTDKHPDKNESININAKKAKYRIIYSKTDQAIYLSHLDLYRNIKLIFRRSHLPVSYSEGFHPMPRISMGPALPTGVSTKEDFLDVILYEFLPPSYLLSQLNSCTIRGLQFISVDPIHLSSPALNAYITHSLFSFKLNDTSFKEYFLSSNIDELLKSHSSHWQWFFNKQNFFISKKKSNKKINLLDSIESITLNKSDNAIYILLKINIESQANIIELLTNVYPNADIPASLTHLRYEIHQKGKKFSIRDYSNSSINIYRKLAEFSFHSRPESPFS